MGDGLFSEADLGTSQAELGGAAHRRGVRCRLAHDRAEHAGLPDDRCSPSREQLRQRDGLPNDPDDERWAHLLIEAATAAGLDRPDALHDGADGGALLDAIDGRLDHDRSRTRPATDAGPDRDGDTTYLCTAGIECGRTS